LSDEHVHAQTYYKLSYVDRRIDNPEQRICEDIPKLCDGLGELIGEWTKCAVDAVFYSWVLRSYARTNKYTAIIIAYVFGAGAMTVSVSPNFGRLFKKQADNEGVLLLPALLLLTVTCLATCRGMRLLLLLDSLI
jgi:ABC-type uncharacterized transport system fused permease/ATPase subunit